jgi:hypothetical protein
VLINWPVRLSFQMQSYFVPLANFTAPCKSALVVAVVPGLFFLY